MPQIIETTVFQINELTDAAKEHARIWYRNNCLDYDWYDSIYADFETVAEMIGLDIKLNAKRHPNGSQTLKPALYFSGFCSQGDGACFEGKYFYKAKASKKIRSYAPKDTDLHAITDRLQSAQRQHFYNLFADISHIGHYNHENSMRISVDFNYDRKNDVSQKAEDEIETALRDLAKWFYRQLEKEYEWLTADEQVDEIITANQYTFTSKGTRFG